MNFDTSPIKERVSIYARESDSDTTKAPPITEQIERAKQYAQENNMEVVIIYQDNGYSGGDWKRPDWNKLINDARGHLFKKVLVWNQDRIARDTEQFLNFYRKLKDSHIQIISLTEGLVDMESVGGTAKHISLAMASEIFRKVTSEKVRKAYEMKKRKAESKGENVGWGRKRKQMDLDFIISLRDSGLGYRQISQRVGGVSYQTIRRALQKAHSKTLKESNEKTGGYIIT